MFSGPMFRWESKVATRRLRAFVYRVVFAVLLGLVGLMLVLIFFSEGPRMTEQARMKLFGRSLLITLMFVELMILLLFVPSHVAGAIPEERSKDTLSMLLLTRLTPFEIVATKAVARWWPSTGPILTGLPLFVAAAWASGLGWESAMAVLVLVSCSGFMAMLTILASTWRAQSSTAFAQAVGWVFIWLLAPPILTIVPIATGSFWGDLTIALRWPIALLAPSSPLSLATDTGWYHGTPGALGLEGRVALMIGLQGLFGLGALGLAAIGLDVREQAAHRLDPTKGHRPACGDDPILWREFELPMRKGAGPIILIRLGYVRILIKTIFRAFFALLALVITLAVPIGLLIATISYGSAAFREAWEHGRVAGGPIVARGHFAMLIRAATGLLALLPALGASSIISARIATERDKKTWDAFLTTPLEGDEILRSKAIVALHGLWYNAWPLLILWAMGLACGAALPAGIALVVVDLAALAWASVALGLLLGIRPGTTSGTSNRSAMWMLIFLLIHTPLLAAALGSPTEFAFVATWDYRLRLGLVPIGLMIPAFTAAMAWHWTRRTRERFDEWVGRPIVGGRIKPP